MRPSSFTQETADRICDLYAGGMLMCRIEEQPGIPCADTIAKWAKERPEFGQALLEARQRHAQAKEEEAEVIADTEPDAQRARNRIEVRKWRAGVINPRTYGPRVDLNVTQTIDFRAAHVAALDRVNKMRLGCDQGQTLVPITIDGSTTYEPRPTDCQSVTVPDDAPDPFS